MVAPGCDEIKSRVGPSAVALRPRYFAGDVAGERGACAGEDRRRQRCLSDRRVFPWKRHVEKTFDPDVVLEAGTNVYARDASTKYGVRSNSLLAVT
jgi:hypothetical protein